MASFPVLCAHKAAMLFCITIFIFDFLVYNGVLLRHVLPVLGQSALIPPLAVVFNSAWVMASWSYLRACASDPGRLSERWHDFVRSAGNALDVVATRTSPPGWQPGKATLCLCCALPRPERAHHCQLCGVCVLRYDHHCPWINNCVGLRNHKFFLLAGIYGWLAGLVALGSSIPYLIRFFASTEDISGDLEPFELAVFVVFGCLTILTTVFLTFLLAFHLPLAARNLTLVEENYENMPNPCDQGRVVANLAQIFGKYGVDWFLPVKPFKPMTDGVFYARRGEKILGPDKLPEVICKDPERMHGLWEFRYFTRDCEEEASPRACDDGPLASLRRWFRTA